MLYKSINAFFSVTDTVAVTGKILLSASSTAKRTTIV